MRVDGAANDAAAARAECERAGRELRDLGGRLNGALAQRDAAQRETERLREKADGLSRSKARRRDSAERCRVASD